MTIPKETIEKAIEGGWNEELQNLEWWFDDNGRMWCDNGNGIPATFGHETYHSIALDRTFWQSLGKALGLEGSTDPAANMGGGIEPEWQENANRFYHCILVGGDTKAFWDELLSKTDSV